MAHIPHGFQRLRRLFLLVRYRQSQTVDPNVFFRNAIGKRRVQNPFRDCDPPLRRLRNAGLVQRQPDNRRAVFFDNGQNPVQHVRLSVDGVDSRLAVVHS